MIYIIQNDNCANLWFLLDFREEGEEVPAYLARGCDRLFKALRAWASDPKLRKVSLRISFLKNPTWHLKFIIQFDVFVDHLKT